MVFNERLAEKSDLYRKTCLPSISVDCVILGFQGRNLRTLLLKIKDEENWILPGGYVGKAEGLEDAAQRILFERSGAEGIFLQQFATFGKLNRSEGYFKEHPEGLWHKGRFISIGFYALVDQQSIHFKPDEFSDACEWFDINKLPHTVMDHEDIVRTALQCLREQLSYKPIGDNLLPEEFTIPELQSLYETILGYKLNRGNFYRRIMRFNILKNTGKVRKEGAHKAPILYRFDKENYQNALLEFNWL